jgi:aspartyl-tRNA(Asn)/glutamyl-tRNA(Gln) amidotransferase subunit A
MQSSDFDAMTAMELRGRIARHEVSPVEATRRALEKAAATHGSLNAFFFLLPEKALAAAKAAEDAVMRGDGLGLLHGVPFSAKDLIAVGAERFAFGSRCMKDNIAAADAPSVERAKRAGGILIGKTTTSEFGCKAVGDSPLTGITRNPWNLQKTPGGSSAGAASSVAGGVTSIALGTDGGGSVRIPGCLTGLAAIKGQFGRIPVWPVSATTTLAHVGPMARTVEDAALLFMACAGHDERDPYSVAGPVPDLLAACGQDVKGLRVAYSPTLGYAKVDPEVARVVEAAVRVLEAQGAIVEQADPGFASPRDAFWTLWCAGCAKVVSGMDATQRAQVDPGMQVAAERGARLSAVDLISAEGERALLMQKTNAFLARYDVLLTPTVAVPALPVGQDLNDPKTEEIWIDWTPFSYPFNMSRQPAASIPCGFTSAGLPVGLQAVAALDRDALVLRVARAYETAHPFKMPSID